MQTVSRYLINNLVTATISGYHGRNSKVYDRRLKIYKGVTNPLTFTFKNEDQKAQTITSKTYEFNMIDTESKASVLTKNLTVIDDGSSLSTKGQASVSVTAGDLLSLDAKFYSYAIREVKSDNSREVTYADTGYNAAGTIELLVGAYPEVVDSVTVQEGFTALTGSATAKASGSIYAYPGENNNIALHTVAVYGTGYSGSFEIEGTLKESPSTNDDWFRISRNQISSLSGITSYNFTGVYQYVRFITDKDSGNTGSVDKILYRH
jgi:hypothetical protein